MRSARALSFVLVALLPACGAILDLPDPTVDAGFGANGDSGYYPDGGPIGDGAQGGDGSQRDGSSGGDGSSGVDSGIGCGAEKCLVGKVSNPGVLANDGTYIYAINGADEIVRFNPLVDTTAQSIATSAATLQQLFVSGSRFFFTGQGGAAGVVASCPVTGCSTMEMDYATGNHPFFGVVADGTNVYYGIESTGSDKGFYSCSIASGACGSSAFLGFSAPRHMRIDATAGRLFWDGNGDLGVYECNLSSCTAADNTGQFLVDIAVNATDTYWTDSTSIHHHARGSSSGDITIANGSLMNVAIAVDSDAVYWLDKGDGTNGIVRKCPLGVDCTNASNPPVQLANGIGDAQDLTVMGSYVFASSVITGIYAIPK